MIHGDVEEIVGFGSVYLMCDVVCLDSEERISIDADKKLLSLPIKSYSESTTYNCVDGTIIQPKLSYHTSEIYIFARPCVGEVTKDTTPVCPIDKHDFANCDVFKMTNPVKSITIISENESESVSGKYMNEVVPTKVTVVSHQLSEYPLLGDEPRASNTVRFSCFHKA
jgi:hypothetical protein